MPRTFVRWAILALGFAVFFAVPFDALTPFQPRAEARGRKIERRALRFERRALKAGDAYRRLQNGISHRLEHNLKKRIRHLKK